MSLNNWDGLNNWWSNFTAHSETSTLNITKTGMSHQGKTITGLEYFKQRVEDAFKTVKGSVPLARGYGSNLNKLIDNNVDDDFIITAYEMVVDTFTNIANGLDDGKFKRLKVNVNNDKVTIDVWVDFLGEEVMLEGLNYA